MIWLDVKITFPDKRTMNCGEIIVDEPDENGLIAGSFQYIREYLEHPMAFPLDPLNLPLSSKEFPVKRREGIHAVFEDALPDDWGRKILIQEANLPFGKQNIANLLEILGDNGLGALGFIPKGEKTIQNSPADIITLPDLLEAALLYDANLPVTEKQLKILQVHGSSPGGARPKVVVEKESKSLWLAKFPRYMDSYLVEPIEAGSLEMAKKSGLNVPDFEIIDIGSRKVLLVKRFDISSSGGRYHMISMQTLLNAHGYYQRGYNDLFATLKKYSFQPSIDIPLLFRQMVFNAAIGNTDDHLKNFCMLHKDEGFCLSPVYDVLPDISGKREHTLSFPLGYGRLAPNKMAFLNIGKAYKIPHINDIIDEVFFAVSNWKEVFRQYNVPESDIQRLDWGIERRLNPPVSG